MITYNHIKIGEYDLIQEQGSYHIEIRQGNCFGVCIWLTEENGETIAHLESFFCDQQHINNMIKSNTDVFESSQNIRLNIADRGAKKIAEYACKMGHEVTIYYEKIKQPCSTR